MKMDEYVPEMIPRRSARTKTRMALPPNRNSASSVNTTVRLVLIDRPNVWSTEWLTIAAKGSPAWRALFSRIRSKTTIVSWTLKSDDRQHRRDEEGIDLDTESVPSTANVPTTTITSWSRATRAETPNFTSWNRKVIQSRIPSAPTRISAKAWLIRSALTTGPTVVSWRWPSIGPNFAWSAVATSPSLPVIGTGGPDGLAVGVGAAEADGLGATDAEGEGEADAEGVALGEGEADADGPAEPDGVAEPDGGTDADGGEDADGEAEGDGDDTSSVGTGVGVGGGVESPIGLVLMSK